LDNLDKKVLELLGSEPSRTFKTKQISRILGIPQNRYQNLRATIRSLVKEGRLMKYPRNRYGLVAKSADVTGQLFVNSQGYGFVSRENGEDIFISQKNMGQALHKDMVQIRLFAFSRGKSPEGVITKVLERTRKKFVGIFKRGKHYNYLIPDDLKINQDIIIAPGEEKNARDGDKVVITIDSWEHKQLNPVGRVVELLGRPENPGVDISSLVHHFELPADFPNKILREADSYDDVIPEEEKNRRLDLRGITVFTIDPADAKDFDDAVSLEKLGNGNIRLGVHIADVSYYVKENSIPDQEAVERGTSVYMVDRVIPMLPERISNHLCSLVQGQDRLCYSVLLELTPSADLINYEIRETIINSKKRLTYQQAQDIIDGKEPSDLKPVLLVMWRMSQKLVEKRALRGGVDFESLEVEVVLDQDGNPVSIRRKERLDTNRLIEEFMLLANETVAKHVGIKLSGQQNEKLPFVYRIHEKPDQKKINEFLQTAKVFGFKVVPPKRFTSRFFQKIAKQFQAHPAAAVLEDTLIRTMMKARYSTENIGHFGLVYDYYTHFTSPIRRYPDLMVHRLLKKYLSGDVSKTDKKELKNKCNIATDREIRAQEAERASIKLKKVEYMERHLGEEFSGVISRMVPFGLFVEIPELLIDGLVHVTSLDDFYIWDEKNFTFIGKNNRKKYKLGDTVRVRVSHVDRNERIIDFVLA